MTPTDEPEGTASIDLTLHLLKYREAARHLWNSFLREEDRNGGVPDDFLLDRWEAIAKVLIGGFGVLAEVTSGPARRMLPRSPAPPPPPTVNSVARCRAPRSWVIRFR